MANSLVGKQIQKQRRDQQEFGGVNLTELRPLSSPLREHKTKKCIDCREKIDKKYKRCYSCHMKKKIGVK